MKISSFSRMRIYRANGRAAVVFRLTLPTAEGEGEAERALRDFYSSLSEAYFEGAALLASLCEGVKDAPVSARVDFCEQSADYTERYCGTVTAIRRTLKIKARGVSRFYEFLDLFDSESGLLIKARRMPKEKKRKKKSPG